jgi:hypothetical protein
MQNIEIKAGTSGKITISPKIKGSAATAQQLYGVTIYVFFVYQFTNKIYGVPYELTANNLTINLTPADTIAMLGNAAENQKYELQFAIKNADGEILAEDKDSSILVNIIKWEAGQWLYQNLTK